MSIKSNTPTIAAFLLMVMALLFIWPSGAVAGTITFDDLTDTLTVSLTPDLVLRGAMGGCTLGVCTVTLPNPFASLPVDIWELSRDNDAYIYESGSTELSDFLYTDASQYTQFVTIYFGSAEDGTSGSPPVFTGISITETGLFQVGTTLVWNASYLSVPYDTVTDTVLFRSDISDVPEPSSLALVTLGLAGLGLSRCKKT